MKNHFLTTLLIASSLIISCDEDDTEDIVTPETESIIPVDDEILTEEVVKIGDAEVEALTEMLEEGGEVVCSPVIELNEISETIAINAPNEFEITLGGFAIESNNFVVKLDIVTDPNEETVNYAINFNGNTIANDIIFPELRPTGGFFSPGNPVITGSSGGRAVGEGNFFRIFGNPKDLLIIVDTSTTPLEINPKGENLIEVVAVNDSGLSRVSSNRVRF